MQTFALICSDRKKADSFLSRVRRVGDIAFHPHPLVVGEQSQSHAPESGGIVVLSDLLEKNPDEICMQVRRTYPDSVLVLVKDGVKDLDHALLLELAVDVVMMANVSDETIVSQFRALHRLRSHRVRKEIDKPKLTFGDLHVDHTGQMVVWLNQPIYLSNSAFAILWCLASQVGQVVSRDELLQQLRATGESACIRSVDAAVCRLRKALVSVKTSGIQTIRQRGYTFWTDPSLQIVKLPRENDVCN